MRKILLLGLLCLVLSGCRRESEKLRELNTVQSRMKLQGEPG